MHNGSFSRTVVDTIVNYFSPVLLVERNVGEQLAYQYKEEHAL